MPSGYRLSPRDAGCEPGARRSPDDLIRVAASGQLAVLESGFRIIPGKEADFLDYQATVVPLAMQQRGFRAVYSGPVLDSTWVYFGARFDSEEQMNAWHGEPQHRVIQKSAPNWWTALYLRKWRLPTLGEVVGDRLMSETSFLVDAALDGAQIKPVRQALAGLPTTCCIH
jgi:heme-degrading monooxygenase HmoA